jgi:hypothetical protein
MAARVTSGNLPLAYYIPGVHRPLPRENDPTAPPLTLKSTLCMRLIPQQTRHVAYYNKEGVCCLPREPFILYKNYFSKSGLYFAYTPPKETTIRLISALCQRSLPHPITQRNCFNQLHADITHVDIHEYKLLTICIQDDEGCKQQPFPEGFENRLLEVIQHFKERETRNSFYLANKLTLGEFSPEEEWVQEPFNEQCIRPGDTVVLMVAREPLATDSDAAFSVEETVDDVIVLNKGILSPICYAVYLAEGLYLSIEDAEESLVTATMSQMRELYKPTAVYTITPKKHSSEAQQATAVKMEQVRIDVFKGNDPNLYPETKGLGLFSRYRDLSDTYNAHTSPARDPLRLQEAASKGNGCIIT